MSKIKIGNIGSAFGDDTTAAERLAEARKNAVQGIAIDKPSPYSAEMRAKLRNRQQLNMGRLPVFVIEEFERLQNKLGMNKTELFYHFLRENGADIPPYSEMDARKY